MEIHYRTIDGLPDPETVTKIVGLHQLVFGQSDDLPGRMSEKPKLQVELGFDGEKLVGYKIGYALNREQLYSWLGGVNPDYRNHGIASVLMERQHSAAKSRGYHSVQTHTKNKWRQMLLLNIRHGFDVIGTYTDPEGEPKIILEKKLNDA